MQNKQQNLHPFIYPSSWHSHSPAAGWNIPCSGALIPRAFCVSVCEKALAQSFSSAFLGTLSSCKLLSELASTHKHPLARRRVHPAVFYWNALNNGWISGPPLCKQKMCAGVKKPLIFSHLLLWHGREKKSCSHVPAFAKFARIARPREWVTIGLGDARGARRDNCAWFARIAKGIVKD